MKHEIKPEELLELVTNQHVTDRLTDDTLGDVIWGNLMRDSNDCREVAEEEVIKASNSLLESLDKAGYVIVKKSA